LCGILLQSAHGFRFCEGSKFAISHWLGRSPLTHCSAGATAQPVMHASNAAPPPLPPLGHICDVMLVWRKENIEKILSLCYSIVYYYNGAQRCEQFLQVSRLYRILILLSLALYLPSASVSLVFMVLYIKKNLLTSFSLPFSELSLMDWPLTWLTNHCPSVQQLWHCWLDYLTCKIVSENNLQCFEWDVKPYYTHTLQMRHIQEI